MRRALALVVATLLAGCATRTVGPDYAPPAAAIANASPAQGRFVGGGEAMFVPSAPLPDRWWTLYDDPLLDRLIVEALAANTDLRIADANLRAAAAAVREAETARTVQTGVGGGASLDRPAGTGGSLPGVVGYDLGGTLSYPLDLFGRIRRAIEAARADREATAAALDYTRVTIAAATARAYGTACTAGVQLAAAKRVLALQRQTLNATRRLQRGGRGTAFDVTRATAAVDQTAATIPPFVAAQRAALFELAALLGRPPAEYPRELEHCARLPLVAKPLPVGDGAALIRRRPDLREAERRLAAATARIGVATAALYPDVSLGGGLGLSGPLGSVGGGNSLRLSLGPLINWTFPNRRAVRARIAQAGASADAALADFDGATLAALRDTETALTRVARQNERVAALARARADSARAGEQAGRLFRFGRADFLDLLSAQATLATAEAALAAAQAQLVDDQVTLFLALGGGWAEAPPVRQVPATVPPITPSRARLP